MSYSVKDIERALRAMIACGGSATEAKRILGDGAPTVATLERWRDVAHSDRYAEIANSEGRSLEEAMVRDFRELANRAAAVQRKAIDRTDELVERMSGPEAAKAALDMAKVAGTNLDKVLVLTGRPDSITEDRTVAEIVRGLEARKLLVRAEEPAIDTSAVELPNGDT